jgi:flagellar motor switch protein FliN/FliY
MSISDVEYQELNSATDESANASATPASIVPNLDMLKHVEVTLEVKVGTATLTVAELFALKAGSVLALDRDVDQPVDILLNGKTVAAGFLAVSGDKLGVRITQIQNNETRIAP